MIGGRQPLVPEILSQSDRVGAKFEQAAITPKRYEIGCQLLLITNRKSHTGFRLVLTSMTLNGVLALILRFFSLNSIALRAGSAG